MIIVQDTKIGRVMSVHKFLTNFVRYYKDVPMNSYDHIRRKLRSVDQGVEIKYKQYLLCERFYDNVMPPQRRDEEPQQHLDVRFN